MDHRTRLAEARTRLAESPADTLLLATGLDLPYLTGYTASPYERLTMLVLKESGDVVLVVPELEAPLVDTSGGLFELRPWSDSEDPTSIVADLAAGASVAAIGDETWSVFLLALQDRLVKTRFISATPLTRELRMRKSSEELDRLRAAGAATDRVAAAIPLMQFGGRPERALAAEVAELVVAEGHDVSTFTIVASGPNSASPHHHTGERVMQEGDSIVIDFGGSFDGYQSDTTRSFHVGEPTAEVAEAHDVLHAAQRAAVAAIRPGVSCASIDRAARAVIEEAGYGDAFIHRTGHGIGLATHEEPYIVDGNDLLLEPTMTFSVEPGIYVAGRFGMRIEDIVAVTESGVESFNNSRRDLVLVE